MAVSLLRGSIVHGRLSDAVERAKDDASFLTGYVSRKDCVPDFQHMDAQKVATEADHRLRRATLVFLDAGGNPNSQEFIEARETARHLGSLKDKIDGLIVKPEQKLQESIVIPLRLAA